MDNKSYHLSGIADEAGQSILEQIEATKALGWSNIEARNIQGVNIHDLPDEEFEAMVQVLQESKIRIDCFASTVANWSKNPLSEEDFELSLLELKRALPRMVRLQTKYLRGMSFRALKESRPDTPEIEHWVVEKLQKLVSMCSDAGVVYLHENCANFGGLSWEHTLRLVERIDSPNFRLIFDTGNPVGTFDRRGKPWERQNSLEFFEKVQDFVDRIHIKDGLFVQATDKTFNNIDHCWPGEGEGMVIPVLTKALHQGFNGTISIEPHLSNIFHEPEVGQRASNSKMTSFEVYVEYGKRLMQILKNIVQE